MTDEQQDLQGRLDRAEAVLDALREAQVDAVVGRKGVLLLSQEQYQMLFQTASDGVVLHEKTQDASESRFIQANAAICRMLGYTAQEMRRLGPADIVTPEDRALIPAESVSMDRNDVYLYEKTLVAKDGSRIATEVNTRIFDYRGRKMVLSIIRDVSARKEAEQALRVANEHMEKLIAERTHDLSLTIEALRDEVARRRMAEEKLLDRTRQLRALASDLTVAEQRERRRLAEILHDHLQQLLVGAQYQISPLHNSDDPRTASVAQKIHNLLTQAITCSRDLSRELNPPVLHREGLGPALQWLADWMREKHGLQVDLQIGQVPVPQPEETKMLLFQSVRELLFNVVKHAGVDRAVVELRQSVDGVAITVSDQGDGFDPQALQERSSSEGGFGLFSIRERLDILGGRMEIGSAPKQGSTFCLILPAEAGRVACEEDDAGGTLPAAERSAGADGRE